jgi:hypothetical protein
MELSLEWDDKRANDSPVWSAGLIADTSHIVLRPKTGELLSQSQATLSQVYRIIRVKYVLSTPPHLRVRS